MFACRLASAFAAAALLASTTASAQSVPGCIRIPFQQTLSAALPQTPSGQPQTQTATARVADGVFFEVEFISARATSFLGEMRVVALSLSTQIVGVRAEHFASPPLPLTTQQLQWMQATSDHPASSSAQVRLYADPSSEMTASVTYEYPVAHEGRIDWTLSGRLVTPGCLVQ
jgi:hypothetical protein